MTFKILTTHLAVYLIILRLKKNVGILSLVLDLLRMYREMKFSADIVNRLHMRELHLDGRKYEMRFMLGHYSVRFLKVKFCTITSLKFGVIPDTTRYDRVENGIHERYFGDRDKVDYEQLRSVLWIGLDEREKIPVWQMHQVDYLDAFDVFSWGAHVYM
ncbi:hypothetical protein Ddye_005699 [Dipteronia dyeriana]|uniref:Uncharacterized protein n=1 Tax=Dipteronia dyeriana TaxID=168575 RepID=A0AAD9XH92_9ROSI|nr:hypothetical protein Ddye_005699 [Dipteronia dyeriana]